ncbi:hypothetical protein J2R98_002373 [Alkalibacillus filiformis]|uniref:PepSY domain-containing protein n=1 Tax=Alkalibacillus filiformis TaxID=200990 RepID=A0ABU0DW42_9BACI|nr:hypothetical protein [Alkalibacillus filiformis]MDQ0352528.1 hypothetical protein [Alkalibacillus filiformis]
MLIKKSTIVITILIIVVITLTILFYLETNKTKNSGQLLEDLLVNGEQVDHNEEVNFGEISELSSYIREHSFHFTNVLEIYDENNENIIYQVEYRYDGNDEIVITDIERVE